MQYFPHKDGAKDYLTLAWLSYEAIVVRVNFKCQMILRGLQLLAICTALEILRFLGSLFKKLFDFL